MMLSVTLGFMISDFVFCLELIDEFIEIVKSPFRTFKGHNQRLFASVNNVCLFYFKFVLFL